VRSYIAGPSLADPDFNTAGARAALERLERKRINGS
jgi:hypothetical protein